MTKPGMRIEALFLLSIALFVAVITVVYWFESYENSGTVMLLAASLLGLVPGTYYYWWSRRMLGRPEDLDQPEPAKKEVVIGAFPNGSIWPFVFAMGCASIALGLVFGLWLLALGVIVVISATAGFTAESRRGGSV
ncbi:MAG: cytochrome c oxidase subunit 4 [Actinobacteria bacterium]|nr:cytochrome c oxidase subunit 4 [Actinomycetota bacterium]MCL6104914.1 cytochrome c oxidase subunit 4 [Actinomycetota bacterium]